MPTSNDEKKKYFRDYMKTYYAKNKEEILKKANERLTCDICGNTYIRSAKSKHCKSKAHKVAVEKNEQIRLLEEKLKKITKISCL